MNPLQKIKSTCFISPPWNPYKPHIRQEPANFFCKGTNSKYCRYVDHTDPHGSCRAKAANATKPVKGDGCGPVKLNCGQRPFNFT